MQSRIVDELMAAARLEDAKAARAGEETEDLGEVALRQLGRSRQVVEQFVLEHPAMSLGAALAAGIVLGWWIKRK